MSQQAWSDAGNQGIPPNNGEFNGAVPGQNGQPLRNNSKQHHPRGNSQSQAWDPNETRGLQLSSPNRRSMRMQADNLKRQSWLFVISGIFCVTTGFWNYYINLFASPWLLIMAQKMQAVRHDDAESARCFLWCLKKPPLQAIVQWMYINAGLGLVHFIVLMVVWQNLNELLSNPPLKCEFLDRAECVNCLPARPNGETHGGVTKVALWSQEACLAGPSLTNDFSVLTCVQRQGLNNVDRDKQYKCPFYYREDEYRSVGSRNWSPEKPPNLIYTYSQKTGWFAADNRESIAGSLRTLRDSDSGSYQHSDSYVVLTSSDTTDSTPDVQGPNSRQLQNNGDPYFIPPGVWFKEIPFFWYCADGYRDGIGEPGCKTKCECLKGKIIKEFDEPEILTAWYVNSISLLGWLLIFCVGIWPTKRRIQELEECWEVTKEEKRLNEQAEGLQMTGVGGMQAYSPTTIGASQGMQPGISYLGQQPYPAQQAYPGQQPSPEQSYPGQQPMSLSGRPTSPGGMPCAPTPVGQPVIAQGVTGGAAMGSPSQKQYVSGTPVGGTPVGGPQGAHDTAGSSSPGGGSSGQPPALTAGPGQPNPVGSAHTDFAEDEIKNILQEMESTSTRSDLKGVAVLRLAGKTCHAEQWVRIMQRIGGNFREEAMLQTHAGISDKSNTRWAVATILGQGQTDDGVNAFCSKIGM